jgi:hypothetical protein
MSGLYTKYGINDYARMDEDSADESSEEMTRDG